MASATDSGREGWRDSTEEQRKGKLEAVDPDELQQRRRVNQIEDAFERVLEKKKETKAASTVGELDRFGARDILRGAVEDLILTLPAIIRRDEEFRSLYWLGEDRDEPIGVIEIEGAGHENIEIDGFFDYLQVDDPIVITEEVRDPAPMGMGSWPAWEAADQSITKQREVQIPRRVSIDVLAEIQLFLDDIDMDLKIDTGLPKDKIGYEPPT